MRKKRASTYGRIKALLLLGRISNLPTVWSNCIAAWLLSGGDFLSSTQWEDFLLLCAGGTCLYLGGMFLNDAWDVEFDREHRPNRPIPSGAINLREVWIWGGGWLATGLACLVVFNLLTTLFSLCLAGCIVWYDWAHKKVSWSPAIMGLCRLFIYLVAASIPEGKITLVSGVAAVVMWAYIVGLSNIARKESTGGRVNSWPCWLLVLPIVLALVMPEMIMAATEVEHESHGTSLLAICIYALWSIRCLLYTFKAPFPIYGRTVSGLLAGIVLVDFLAVAILPGVPGLIFFGLFGLALLFQRYIPAT